MLSSIVLLFICIIKIIFVYLFFKPQNFWKSRNVPYEEPEFFYGNLKNVILKKTSMAEYLRSVYQKHEGRRYVGIFQFFKPAIIIRDLDLITKILITDNDVFPQRVIYTSTKSDPIWANNLFAMPGNQHWQDLRAILSPAFTAKKLRHMFVLIDKCSKQLTSHIKEKNDYVELEMNETFARVINDIIASTALGASCNSLKEPNNEIFVMGSRACDVSRFPKNLKFFISNISPTLTKIVGLRFISEKTRVFFNKIIRRSIAEKQKHKSDRQDMVYLMLKAQRGELNIREDPEDIMEIAAIREPRETYQEKSDRIEITDDVMAAQAVLFFLAGYETTSTVISFAAYELAIRPDIQQTLLEEINSTMDEFEGKLTYDVVARMKYLDRVISEVLRKWPPLAVADRTAIHNYTIKPEAGEGPVEISKDVICLIPIYAIHRDERYFPNPETFDPDRFVNPTFPRNAYMPFGLGRRFCIGSRFALVAIKTVLVHLLYNFEIVPIRRTPIPMVLSTSNVNPSADRGFWLGLKPRDGVQEYSEF